MSNTADIKLCPFCHKPQVLPINLRCQHHPCHDCAQANLQVQTESNLQKKYRLICPLCSKKTVIYDIRSLIINGKDRKDVNYQFYVSSKYLQKINENKANMKYKSNVHSRNNSNSQILQSKYYQIHQELKEKKQSNDQNLLNDSSGKLSVDKKSLNVSHKQLNESSYRCQVRQQKQWLKQQQKQSSFCSFESGQSQLKTLCHSHKSKIKYFCYDCFQNKGQNNKNQGSCKSGPKHNQKVSKTSAFLCQKCAQTHTSFHNILTLNQSGQYVYKQNAKNISQINKYKSQLKRCSQELSQTKQQIVSSFKLLQKQIGGIFQQFKSQIEKIQKSFKDSLKASYSQSVKYLNLNIQMLKKTKQEIQHVQKLSKTLQPKDQVHQNIAFYQSFCELSASISSLNQSMSCNFINIPKLPKVDQYDIKNCVQSLLHLNVKHQKQNILKQNTLKNHNQFSHKKSNSGNVKLYENFIDKDRKSSRKNSASILYEQKQNKKLTQKPFLVQVDLKKLAL